MSGPRLTAVARTALAIPGGYVATSALASALAVASATLGLARDEAATLGALLGFPLYLGLILWAFGAARLRRPALGFAGLTALGLAVVWLGARTG
jgi:hypothetical protein